MRIFAIPGSRFDYAVEQVQYAGLRALVAATLAWILIRARRPRPSWRRLTRQPGWAACSAAALVIAFQLAIGLPMLARRGFVSWGQVVLWWGGWATVRDRPGRGRRLDEPRHRRTLGAADRHWIDRSGRIIGLAWLSLGLTNLSYEIWSLFDPAPFLSIPPIPMY